MSDFFTRTQKGRMMGVFPRLGIRIVVLNDEDARATGPDALEIDLYLGIKSQEASNGDLEVVIPKGEIDTLKQKADDAGRYLDVIYAQHLIGALKIPYTYVGIPSIEGRLDVLAKHLSHEEILLAASSFVEGRIYFEMKGHGLDKENANRCLFELTHEICGTPYLYANILRHWSKEKINRFISDLNNNRKEIK